ncbi:MAG: hypothetical protein JW751_05895 [Polyangiaceae bacterium]|nr:hypothetical protein [Polyangiaceae bacterium]
MSQLVIRGLSAPGLTLAELTLGPGLYPILSRAEPGSALVAAIGGQLRGRSGTVTVGGADPQRSPRTRARIALLLAAEALMPARTVATSITEALGPREAPNALAAVGLETWARRDPRRLSPAECRSVALAVALATSQPLVAALYEPLAATPGMSRDLVIDRLRELAANGTTVIPVTSSVRDVERIGGDPHVLGRGIALRIGTPFGAQHGGRDAEFVLEASSVRKLAAGLLDLPAITGLTFDEVLAPTQVRVRSVDARAGSLAILQAASERGVSITTWRLEPPTLDVMQATAASAARAAVERRPAAASPDPWTVAMPFGLAPPPPPPPPGGADPPFDGPEATPPSTEEVRTELDPAAPSGKTPAFRSED